MIMQFELIRDKIWDLNLAIDLNSIRLIEQFIVDKIGSLEDLSQQELLYTIYAAAGIVVEELKVLTVDGKEWVSTGLTIELLMSKLDRLDLQKYLGYIDTLLLKHKQAKAELIHKVQQLNISFRLFCKYRKLMTELFRKMRGSFLQLIQDTTSLIWQMYLLYKHQHSQLDIQEQTKTLIGCIFYVFNKMEIKNEEIDYQLIKLEFRCYETVNQNQIIKVFDELLDDLLVKRYNEGNFFGFYKNVYKRQRLLDDVRIRYEQVKNTHLPVDEIKYLKLPKNLTPFRSTKPTLLLNTYNIKLDFEGISPDHHAIEAEIEQGDIFQKLDLDEFEDSPKAFESKVESLHQPMFGQYQYHSKADITPLQSKTKDVQWVNVKIGEMNEMKTKQLISLFQEVNLKAYSETQSFCYDLIQKLMSMTTSSESAIESRKTKIWSLFTRILLKLSLDSYPTIDKHILLSDRTFIRTVLCIMTYIYLVTNSLPLGQLKEVCKIYECSYQHILYHLNKICKLDLGMPPTLSQHMSALESTILLRHAWEDEIAYGLLKRESSDIYSEFFIERLHNCIHQRISELTKNHKMFNNPIKELVFYVLVGKPGLLDGNFIDQIILCSFYHVISANPEESALTFEEIFRIYSKLPNSFQEYKNRVTVDSITYTLLQFYQTIFSPVVSEFLIPQIMKEQPPVPELRRQPSVDSNYFSTKNTNMNPRLLALKRNAQFRKSESMRVQKEGEEGEGLGSLPLIRTLSFSRDDDNSVTFGFNRVEK